MILDRQRKVRVARQPLESFLHLLGKELNLGTSDVTVCLVSDAEIARMNETFRKKKGPTDVLSFPAAIVRSRVGRAPAVRSGRASHSKALRNARISSRADYLGDIAISPSTAMRNAKNYGRTLPSELKVLILHGMLHLLGYDHETDQGEMDRIERRLRHRFGLA